MFYKLYTYLKIPDIINIKMKKPNNILRVTQMNAVYFDKELNNIFRNLLQDSTKFLPQWVVSKHQAEINAIVRVATIYYSIIRQDCTFGQKILSIKYSNLTPVKKQLFTFITVTLLYLKDKLHYTTTNNLLISYLDKFSLVIKLLKFCNLSLFLRTGEKPRLMERFLNLDQVSTDIGSSRSYDKYMTRELIWNGLIEIFIYMLPLINYHKTTRIFKNLFTIRKVSEVKIGNSAKMNLDTVCAHCREYPVNPNHMGCEHVFCYSCLKGNQAADEKYKCPKCDYSGKSCDKLLLVNF